MYSEALYKQTRKEGKQWGKIGFDASRAASGLYQSLGYDQAKLIGEMFPQYAGALRNAFSWLSPGSQQSQIDAYRNQMLQTAQQAGQNSANTARWMGLGSGTQGSLINAATQRGISDVGNYASTLPGQSIQNLGVMMGLMSPTFAQFGQSLKAGQNSAYPSKGLGVFGNILSAGANLYGMGAFGGGGGMPMISLGGLGT